MTERDKIYNKFNGRCAYSGTLLEHDWQADHVIPKRCFDTHDKSVDNINNVVPCQRLINHYKRALFLEDFRNWYLGGLHERLKKLPRNPKVERSKRKKEYLLKVAGYFGITPDKPFSGIFYFETLKNK